MQYTQCAENEWQDFLLHATIVKPHLSHGVGRCKQMPLADNRADIIQIEVVMVEISIIQPT